MKTIHLNHYQQYKRIAILVCLCAILLIIRIKTTGDFYLLFMVWNLILAFIPFLISNYLAQLGEVTHWSSGLSRLVLYGSWLLFIPNAPYIITDLIHIKHTSMQWILFDSMLLLSFAVLGTYLGLISISSICRSITRDYLSNKNHQQLATKYVAYMFLFLCSFGIYLGRTLRYNSWDIIQNPEKLWLDIWQLVLSPVQHLNAWLFIGSMFLLLTASYQLIKKQ